MNSSQGSTQIDQSVRLRVGHDRCQHPHVSPRVPDEKVEAHREQRVGGEGQQADHKKIDERFAPASPSPRHMPGGQHLYHKRTTRQPHQTAAGKANRGNRKERLGWLLHCSEMNDRK